MGYFFILVALAVVVGAITKAMPSKRQRQLEGLRMQAREAGVSVRYAPINYTSTRGDKSFITYGYSVGRDQKNDQFEFVRRISPLGEVEGWRSEPDQRFSELANYEDIVMIKGSDKRVEICWLEKQVDERYPVIVKILAKLRDGEI